jgi:hypothetical protein
MDWKFDGTEDMLDSRDIVERIEELEALMEDEEAQKALEAMEFEGACVELAALKKLADEASSSPDWTYGEQLIHIEHFEDYIEQLIDECYPEVSKALSSGDWPMRHLKLDIEDAAREAQVDYFEVEYNGQTYLIRA